MKKTLLFALIIAILFTLTPAPRAEAFDADPVIRVGLYYGSAALASANLENFVGSGYRFGYFDSSRNFTEVSSTTERKITMIPAGGNGGVNVVVTGTSNVIYKFDNTIASNLAVRPDITGEAQPVTWFKGFKYGGAFEYVRNGSGSLSVINYVGIQDYVKGVIPYEMSPQWPLEALKAQALCAKSYAMTNLNRHKSSGFDLCNDIEGHCQVYRGFNAANDATNAAVDSTYGQYITYLGSICNTFFHSSSGGYTENSENVWNEAIPYLRATPSPYEDLSRAENGTWHTTYTNASIKEVLNAKNYNIGSVVNAYIDEFTQAGNVYRLVVVDGTGKKWPFERENARLALNSPSRGLGINSMRYSFGNGGTSLYLQGSGAVTSKSSNSGLYAISAMGIGSLTSNLSDMSIISGDGITSLPQTVDTTQAKNGVYEIYGRGWGHNVGMSQWGARGMAEQGYTYDQIIRHYFTGVEITYN